MGKQIEKVAKAIYNSDVFYLENQGESVAYNYERFKMALKANDVCSDPRAVRGHWETFIAKGIIEEVGAHFTSARFHVTRFNKAFGYRIDTYQAHTHAHTHILQEGSE